MPTQLFRMMKGEPGSSGAGGLNELLRRTIDDVLAEAGVEPDRPLVQSTQVTGTRAVFAYMNGFVRLYLVDLNQTLPDNLPGKQLLGKVDFNFYLHDICPRIEKMLKEEGFEYEQYLAEVNPNQHVVYYQFQAELDIQGHPVAYPDAFAALCELRDELQKG